MASEPICEASLNNTMVDCQNSPHMPISSISSTSNVEFINSCSASFLSKEPSHSPTPTLENEDPQEHYEEDEKCKGEAESEELESNEKSLESTPVSEDKSNLNDSDEIQLTKEIGSELPEETPVDACSQAIENRKQPLMELQCSEESYVRRLRIAYELYMPAVYRSSGETVPTSTAPVATPSSSMPSNCNFEELAAKLPPGGPTVPDDLVDRWRILWGNWLQLYEWHTGFLEKLKALLEEDPDRIPKLFIDSRAKLRSIYSKYCENQIKAAHIAEQHKEFFDEWRIHVADKEDVVSLLMQPVQRIMRYQLPIGEIVKWTERAQLPSLSLWQKALEIMKEIPKDTQLILEAARIDGFPGVITSLGTLRIRGDLLVASLSHAELATAVSAYALSLTGETNSAPVQVPPVLSSPQIPVVPLTPSPSATVMETPVTTGSAAANNIAPNRSNSSLVFLEDTAVTPSVLPDASTNQLPGQKFVVSRLFLFDKVLLVTEEMKAKRKGTIADQFAQSTYQFRASINVNKMRFEPYWFMCSLAQDADGKLDAFRASLEQVASDDLKFVVWDQTPGRDVVYIIDPQSVAVRSAWVIHLRDIQRMQQQLLMALVDPTRFANASGGCDQNWESPAPTTLPDVGLLNSKPEKAKDPQPSRKWPSFNMRRSTRLSSSSSTNASVVRSSIPSTNRIKRSRPITHQRRHDDQQHQQSHEQPTSASNLLRSYSAERHRVNVPPEDGRGEGSSSTRCSRTTFSVSNLPEHRKSSDGYILESQSFETAAPAGASIEITVEDGQKNTMGFQKTKKVIYNLFGKHKKGRQHSSSNIVNQPTSNHAPAAPPQSPPVKQTSESTPHGHHSPAPRQRQVSDALPPFSGQMVTPDSDCHKEHNEVQPDS